MDVTVVASASPAARTAVTIWRSIHASPFRTFLVSKPKLPTSTATRTSADSFAKLTDAETQFSSISRIRFTFAVHPPQCIPRTSRSTTSSTTPEDGVAADDDDAALSLDPLS